MSDQRANVLDINRWYMAYREKCPTCGMNLSQIAPEANLANHYAGTCKKDGWGSAEPVKERDVRELINELGLAVARMEQTITPRIVNGYNDINNLACASKAFRDQTLDRLAALDTRLEREFNAQADWCSETGKILQLIVKKRKKKGKR